SGRLIQVGFAPVFSRKVIMTIAPLFVAVGALSQGTAAPGSPISSWFLRCKRRGLISSAKPSLALALVRVRSPFPVLLVEVVASAVPDIVLAVPGSPWGQMPLGG